MALFNDFTDARKLRSSALATHLVADCFVGSADCSGNREWIYKAEGGANVAFAYVGHRQPQLQGHLLRLRKRTSKAATVSQRGDSPGSELLPHDPLQFASTHMRPLVGPQYVVPGTKVLMPKAILQRFQEQLDTLNLSGMRPAHRSDDSLDVDCGFGVLMLDHSIVPPPPADTPAAEAVAAAQAASCVDLCVEIKPKAGVLPPGEDRGSNCGSESAGAGSGRGSARPTCRYCQHQVLKALESTGGATDAGASPLPPSALSELASTLSHYCPLDLYSGKPDRVLRALAALVRCPQNNFRLFAGGRPVFTHESAANYRRSRACETARSEASAAGGGSDVAASAGEVWSPQDCASHLEEVLTDMLGPDSSSGSSTATATATVSSRAASGSLEAGLAHSGLGLPRHCSLLIRVLAAILCEDGLLRSLAAAQALDDCGPDAAHAAFQRAAALAAAGSSEGNEPAAAAAAFSVMADADGAAEGAASVAPRSADAKAVAAAVEAACAAAVASADGGAIADSDAHARQRELAEAGRLLSRFMLAASAKDCSVLIAFRLQLPSKGSAAADAGDSSRVKTSGGAGAAGVAAAECTTPASAPHAAAAGLADGGACAAAAGHADGGATAAGGSSFSSLLGDDHPGRNSGSVTIELTDARAPAAFDGEAAGRQRVSATYSLAVVDLDPKPLARIPQYAALDARIRAAFASHGEAMFAAAGKTCGAWSTGSAGKEV